MSAAWVRPTARAIPWGPLAGVAACLAAGAALTALTGPAPAGVLGIAAAALAAAVVAAQHDPAAALLAAVPVSAARRRASRQALTLPAGLVVWLLWIGLAGREDPALGWPVGPVVALTATGLAVAVWAPARFAVPAGVAAPLVWLVAARAAGSGAGPAGLLTAWQHHPWHVTAAAGAALLIRRNR